MVSIREVESNCLDIRLNTPMLIEISLIIFTINPNYLLSVALETLARNDVDYEVLLFWIVSELIFHLIQFFV